jgi:Integrase zinc binding domain
LKQSSDRLMRWQLLLKEYKIEWQHIKGEQNIFADALSQLPNEDSMENTELEGAKSPTDIAYAVMRKKEVQETNFPMNPILIAKHQHKDVKLQNKVRENIGNRYYTKIIEGVTLIVREDNICVPLALQEHIVAWCHKYLTHPGINRTELTIRQLFTWPRIKHHVEKYCSTCRICQTVKSQRKQYGHLPIKNLSS